MSHMDPVSGTDIDLFIEGIIPCSLHLGQHKAKSNTQSKVQSQNLLCKKTRTQTQIKSRHVR